MLKVNMEIAQQIRLEYATGRLSYRSLAYRYGLTAQSVGNIVRRQTWVESDFVPDALKDEVPEITPEIEEAARRSEERLYQLLGDHPAAKAKKVLKELEGRCPICFVYGGTHADGCSHKGETK